MQRFHLSSGLKATGFLPGITKSKAFNQRHICCSGSTDGRIIQVAYALPLDDDPAKESDCKLIFRIKDGRHYLYGGWGPFGRRVLTGESVRPVPSGDDRAEVPLIYR